MSRRALVTGANGFVGTFLCSYLRAHGWSVRGAVHEAPERDDWIRCDVRDPERVEHLFAWAGPVTHVFHLAGIAFVPEASRDPGRAFDVNLGGTLHVAQAMQRHAPDARLIFAGSSGAYGPPRAIPITEEHPLDPQSPYDISKAAADQYLAYAHRSEGLDVVRLRAFNHSGPGQSPDFVLPSFARQVARIEAGLEAPVIRVGNLSAERDFSHVRDVVRAYEAAARRGHAGEVYNVCSGRSRRVQDALDILLGLSSVNIRVEVDPERLRPVDVEEVRGSHAKLTEHTGWTPETNFEELLQDLLTYWRERTADNSPSLRKG